MRAVVIKSTGSWYTVKTTKGQVLDCRIRGKFRIKGIKSTNPIVVGDLVSIEQEGESWLITKLEERKNFIVRKSVNLSKQTHIIAANVDQAILMVTIQDPITTTGFIDRFLAAAQSYRIQVLIIFNKLDIYDQKMMQSQKQLHLMYEKIGYKCIALSVLQDSLDKVKVAMKSKVNVIAGHSGVGKSTLINKLQPGLDLTTKTISDSHKQGQHTTTFSQLHELNFGASIIDTPGIRGFGLVDMKKEEVGDYFKEFLILKKKCKFHNCIHLNEPNCAVKSALQKGMIFESRYKCYLSLLDEEDQTYRKNDYE